jgi:hypothetical protein
MALTQFKKPRTGWRHEGWRSCKDLNLEGMEGVPRWFRCQKCNALVTHGQVQTGGCECGNRRLHPANMLTWPEIVLLKLGRFRLNAREQTDVRPLVRR